jgi:hypothetical protein
MQQVQPRSRSFVVHSRMRAQVYRLQKRAKTRRACEQRSRRTFCRHARRAHPVHIFHTWPKKHTRRRGQPSQYTAAPAPCHARRSLPQEARFDRRSPRAPTLPKRGGSSFDAATAAVAVFEDAPLFNAHGRGLQQRRRARARCCGHDRRTPSCRCAGRAPQREELFARAVMESSPHTCTARGRRPAPCRRFSGSGRVVLPFETALS